MNKSGFVFCFASILNEIAGIFESLFCLFDFWTTARGKRQEARAKITEQNTRLAQKKTGTLSRNRKATWFIYVSLYQHMQLATPFIYLF